MSEIKVSKILESMIDGGAMTVGELIEALSDLPEDAIVMFQCDYGDYCHTQQALAVEGLDLLATSDLVLHESSYSRSGLAVSEIDEDDPQDPQGLSRPVVVLK